MNAVLYSPDNMYVTRLDVFFGVCSSILLC